MPASKLPLRRSTLAPLRARTRRYRAGPAPAASMPAFKFQKIVTAQLLGGDGDDNSISGTNMKIQILRSRLRSC